MQKTMLCHWFFFSSALKPFGISFVRGDWMLDSADTPRKMTGIRMNRETKSTRMRPGVRSW